MFLCKFSLKWYQFSQIVDFIKLIIYNKSRWWEYDNVICRKTDRFGNKAWCDFWRRQKCLSLWIWQFAVYFITVLFLCPVENKNKPLNSEHSSYVLQILPHHTGTLIVSFLYMGSEHEVFTEVIDKGFTLYIRQNNVKWNEIYRCNLSDFVI